MEGANTSMHSSSSSTCRTVSSVAAAGLAAAVILFFTQQPTALGQSPQNSSNQQNGGILENRLPSTNAQGTMVTVPEDFANLKLAPGFLLNVQVYGESDFSGPVRVDNAGNITLPFLKPVHVAGDTLAEAQAKVAEKFQGEGILKNPQITIDVQQFATTTATVLGEVQSPGKVELLAPHNMLDVIGLAGGETSLAGNLVELKHVDASAHLQSSTYHYSRGSNGDAIRDVMVAPGDTVIVKRAGIVYVLGAVNRPGGYAMQEDGELNVAQAISMAQGMALQAKTGALRVVRHNSEGQSIDVPVSYKEMMNGKQVPPSLSAGDIVYVPISKTKAVLSASTSLIGQTTAATIYAVH